MKIYNESEEYNNTKYQKHECKYSCCFRNGTNCSKQYVEECKIYKNLEKVLNEN